MRLVTLNGLFNLFLVETASVVISDDDFLFALAGLFNRRHLESAVGVHVERHLDLRHSAWHRGDVCQAELPETIVVCGPLMIDLISITFRKSNSIALKSTNTLKLLKTH